MFSSRTRGASMVSRVSPTHPGTACVRPRRGRGQGAGFASSRAAWSPGGDRAQREVGLGGPQTLTDQVVGEASTPGR